MTVATEKGTIKLFSLPGIVQIVPFLYLTIPAVLQTILV